MCNFPRQLPWLHEGTPNFGFYDLPPARREQVSQMVRGIDFEKQTEFYFSAVVTWRVDPETDSQILEKALREQFSSFEKWIKLSDAQRNRSEHVPDGQEREGG